jgi:hypothetical protein
LIVYQTRCLKLDDRNLHPRLPPDSHSQAKPHQNTQHNYNRCQNQRRSTTRNLISFLHPCKNIHYKYHQPRLSLESTHTTMSSSPSLPDTSTNADASTETEAEATLASSESLQTDMPLTMAASVVLDHLPRDAHTALSKAGLLEQDKSKTTLSHPILSYHTLSST